MNYNILIGGAAGQGMNTLATIISKSLKRHGFHVFMNTVYMSRIRGGHNYFQIRFSDAPVTTHSDTLDMVFALNQETVDLHTGRLKSTGVVLSDQSVKSNRKVLIIDSKSMAKSMGHNKGENIILLGALTKLFDLDQKILMSVLKEKFKDKSLDLNSKAFLEGYKVSVNHFATVDKVEDNRILLNGNTAIALGAITAGLDVYSAYPMTPATSVMNYLIKKQKQAAYVVEQAEDEIAAIHIALGAASAGARAMTGSSGGGLALMVEALGLTAITETPLVIVDVMRPGPATGLPTKTGQSDLSFMLTASQDEFPRMIMAVRSVEDAFYQTIRAFDLADKYQVPVIILSDQYLADASRSTPKFNFDINYNRYLAKEEDIDTPYARYKLTESGVSPRILPGQYKRPVIADNHEHDPYGKISEAPQNRVDMHRKRLKKLDSILEDIQEPKTFGDPSADIVLVGFGSTEGAIEEAVTTCHSEGLSVSGLVFGDVYPLPTKKLLKLKNKTLINVEMNATGQLARLIRMETGLQFSDSILKFDGLQINAENIMEVLNERLQDI
jgi:2-oxoglutarate ferredoxin oxidoreductase subunit alpha